VNILVITYWSYKDALIQTYTLPYLRIMRKYLPAGSNIYLVTLEQPHHALTASETLTENQHLASYDIQLIPFRYVPFGAKAVVSQFGNIIKLQRFIQNHDIDILHAWCTPAGALGYILSRMTGRKLIIDSYEPHAEPMLESGTWNKNGMAFRLLFTLEKLQSQRAETVIACVDKMRDYASNKYGVSFDRLYSKPACVDLDSFDMQLRKDSHLLRELGLEDKIVCVYAGKFGGSYLTQETFDFFKTAEDKWGERFRALLLNNQPEAQILEWASNSGFDPQKIVKRFVPHAEVAKYIGLGDFGITPFIPVPSKRYGTPIKTGEYWAMGLPVVITPNISDDSDIIEEHKIGSVIPTLDHQGYQQAIDHIDHLLSTQNKYDLSQKIRAIAHNYRGFHLAEKVYQQVYGNIL